MVTAQEIFTTAMHLMDEISEDGTYSGYPSEYKDKAWPILTLLQTELLKPSETPTVIIDGNSTFIVDERTARTALPYGLASHLLMTEDQNRASYFNSRYDELKRKRPTTITTITDVYGVANGINNVDSSV